MIGNPFHRSIAMFAAIQAFASAGMRWSDAVFASGVGEYRSRGKGKGKGASSSHCAAYDQRAARKARNRKMHRAHCR
jgi:hypothetical protein